MSEQQYKLEENNQTNELILWEDVKILNVFKSSYDNRKHLNIIVDRLNKQQAIISQLRQENKKLKRQLNKQNTINIQLRETNKEIGDDLYNCRVNKNIISKALKLWQETLAEYDIYTINDFTELFEARKKDKKIKYLVEELMKDDN